MVFGNLSKWWLTDVGKKWAFYTASATSTGIVLAHIIPQTFLLDQYKKIIQYYRYMYWECLSIPNFRHFFFNFRKGTTVPLSNQLQERFQSTLDLLEVHSLKWFPNVFGYWPLVNKICPKNSIHTWTVVGIWNL